MVIRGKEQPVGCPEKWLSGLAPQRCFGALVSAAAAEGWGQSPDGLRLHREWEGRDGAVFRGGPKARRRKREHKGTTWVRRGRRASRGAGRQQDKCESEGRGPRRRGKHGAFSSAVEKDF